MKLYGLSALSDFWGDFIVYRNLKPADPRLPALGELRGKLNLSPGVVPRKNETDYARVVVEILEQARNLTAPGADIRRVVFLGDTRLLDSTAFANLCAAGGWPGVAFIGSETTAPFAAQTELMPGGQALYLSNRWAALDGAFREFVAEQGFPVDEHTALLIDIEDRPGRARAQRRRHRQRPRPGCAGDGCRAVGSLHSRSAPWRECSAPDFDGAEVPPRA
ncbi:MAG: hypothetical protein ACUVRJ_09740 [Candidatus Villigracilaceae bacterium]